MLGKTKQKFVQKNIIEQKRMYLMEQPEQYSYFINQQIAILEEKERKRERDNFLVLKKSLTLNILNIFIIII